MQTQRPVGGNGDTSRRGIWPDLDPRCDIFCHCVAIEGYAKSVLQLAIGHYETLSAA